MSLFRTPNTPVNERPSALIQLRLVDKLGLPIDPSAAWAALVLAFKDHPHFTVHKAEISPDKGSSINV